MLKRFFFPRVDFCVDNCDIKTLNKLKNLKLYNIKISEEHTKFQVALINKAKACRILANQTFTIKESKSIVTTLNFVYSNVFLVCCILVTLLGLVLAQTLVFRVRIEGLEGAEAASVRSFLSERGFGSVTTRGRVNDDLINNLTQNFDFIAHATGFISGTTFVVRAYRVPTPPLHILQDIVASHDAVIVEMIVLSGVPLVKPGDSVRVGQILVQAAFQVGVEVGEPNEYGQLTYTPIMHPGTAMAFITGRVSYTKSSIIKDAEMQNIIVAQLANEIKSENSLTEIERKDVFVNQLEDGGFAVEVIVHVLVEMSNLVL